VRVTNQTWHRLSAAQKAGLIVAAVALPCVGGVAVLGASTPDDKATTPAATAQVQQLADQVTETSPAPTKTTPKATPKTETRTVTETEPITFKKRTVKDDYLPKGEKEERTAGRKGTRTLTYTVTLVDGKETGRKLVGSKVTRKPVDEVIAVGTHVEPDDDDGGCAPGYDPCVPVASDVDCAGGSGNGPEYVDGPITVTGSDPYDLDRDGDGIACDT
jgi:resuscitation-promoting factor RpfB